MKEQGIDPSEYYKPVDVVIHGVVQKISMLICEDIWNINKDYDIDPVALTKIHNPDIIAVASASPFGIDKARFRNKLLSVQSAGTRIAYVNPIGIQNNGKNIFAFDGGSAEYKNGSFVHGVADFTSRSAIQKLELSSENEQIHATLIYVLREFMKSIGDKKVVIGLS